MIARTAKQNVSLAVKVTVAAALAVTVLASIGASTASAATCGDGTRASRFLLCAAE
jgi:hypothetical protein